MDTAPCDTIACPAKKIAEKAGFSLPDDKKFLIVKEDKIGKEHPFSTEKLGTLAVNLQIQRL